MKTINTTINTTICTLMLVLLFPFNNAFASDNKRNTRVVIQLSAHPSIQEAYAAREVRRYLYLRTGELIPIAMGNTINYPLKNDLIVIGKSASPLVTDFLKSRKAKNPTILLKEQSYWLKSFNIKKKTVVLITGKDEAGTLRGAYKFIENFGVRFAHSYDIIPDDTIRLTLPILDLVSSPVFDIRGNFPYFCNPEGPDNWNASAFKAYITQQVKLGMNFIGLRNDWAMKHLWKGIPEDLNEDGSLKFAYKTFIHEAYQIKDVAAFGSHKAFKSDVYVTDSWLNTRRMPDNMERQIAIHEANGQLLKEAFAFARKMGIYTAVGSEVPITDGVPDSVKAHIKKVTGKEYYELERELYKGTFTRTIKLLDPDYYWLNTNERWIWDKPENVAKEIPKAINSYKIAIDVKKELGARFKFATMGWVLGPKFDRTLLDRELPKDIIISSQVEDVGRTSVDTAFSKILNRDKWVIPWMESDFNLLSPQLWVNRTLQNALDAQKYGCNGLIGVHWRTRTLTPQMQALAYIGWNGFIDTNAFYDDFCKSNFGANVARAISKIFRQIDGNLPQASDWKDGWPGGIYPDSTYWEKEKGSYQFVADLETIRPNVVGAGNLERFDYYLNQYKYLRSLGKLKSSMGTPAEDIDLRDALNYLMQSTYTTGELGNITTIARQIGKGKPENYTGKPHLIVLTPRTSLEPKEDYLLDVMFLEKANPQKITLYWRELGATSYKKIQGQRKELNHYTLQLTFNEIAGTDIEYYIVGETSTNEKIYFPATAPQRGLTIVQINNKIPETNLYKSTSM